MTAKAPFAASVAQGAARPRVLLLCQSLALAGGVERFVCALANHLAGQGFDTAVGSVDSLRAEVAYPLAPAVRWLTGRPPSPSAPVATAPVDAASSLARPRSPCADESPSRPSPAQPASPPPLRAPPFKIPAAGPARAWALLRNQWRTGRALAQLIACERPDVVVLNGLTTACSVLLFRPGCAARAICCDHNHFDARSRPWRWLRARLYPKVAALVSLTGTDAPRFRALNPRTEVIANASMLRRDAPPGPRAGDVPPLVLAVGRCAAQKGLDLLLLAWQQVLQDGPAVAVARPAPAAAGPPGAAAPAFMPTRSTASLVSLPESSGVRGVAPTLRPPWPPRLRIVGDGPLREALVAETARLGLTDSVEWLAPTADIERHYREADVFVLPSRYEGLPLVLLEAQAMGLPSVAFDCPTGPAEIVTADTGIVVPPQDVRALAEALTSLLAQPALRQAMGRAAWQRSRDRFGPEAHFERWTALIRSVAGQGGALPREAGRHA